MSLNNLCIDSNISSGVVNGTMINTNKGIYKIEDVFDENLYVLDEDGNRKRIYSHHSSKMSECYTIRFSNGYSISGSKDCRLLTESGWKLFNDLNINDKIFYRNNINYDEVDYLKVIQPNIDNIHFNSKIYNFPKFWNEDFALFLGMWLSDGSTNENGIGICEKNQIVGELIDDLILHLFGIESKISLDKRSNVKTHSIYSKYISRYFKYYFGDNAVNKKVPDEILKSKKSVQLSFLKGLTLDGYKTENRLIIYEGYSKNIVECVSEILQRLGYRFHIGNRSVKNGRLSKITYSISVYLTSEDNEIQVIEQHKLDFKKDGYFNISRYIPKEKHEQLLESIDHTIEGSWRKRNIRNSLLKNSFIRESTLLNVGWKDFDSFLDFLTVKEKTYIGLRETFNIKRDSSSYLIGGIVLS